MEDKLYWDLLSWFMEQDPWDWAVPHSSVEEFLDEIAQSKDFQNWIAAYHYNGD